MRSILNIKTIPLDSTKLYCNFVNTVHAWKGENHVEYLTDYAAFIDWCARLNIYDDNTLVKLQLKAKAEPVVTDLIIVKIRLIRQLVHDFISAIANQNKEGVTELLGEINMLISEAISHTALEFSDNRFKLSYQNNSVDLFSPVWVIVKSLYDLLLEGELARIKECGTCGWLFYDETKNSKRRWCNPLNCGTKNKMANYNQRLKEKKNV